MWQTVGHTLPHGRIPAISTFSNTKQQLYYNYSKQLEYDAANTCYRERNHLGVT